METFRFIDLFAGIGGFRLAFERLGGRCVFSSEINPHSHKTYAANFGDVPHGDICQITAAEIPHHDLLLGGFPCQAFSIAGRRGGFEDARGTLFFEIARILQEKRPRAFVLENVKGLTHHHGGRTLARMLAILREELGYHVPEPQVLNARHFGLAQSRERIFLVGFAGAEPAARFVFPTGNGQTAVFGDVREGAAVPARYYLSQTYLDTLRRHRARHESKGNGFGYEVIGEEQVANTLVLGGMGRERNLVHDPRLQDTTPETRIVGPINEEMIRRMTPREWARLQGFPDSFTIPVSDTQAYRQFANAVPVPMVQAVGAAVLAALAE